jgi:maltooligosyltrehalose trehalohydrolase
MTAFWLLAPGTPLFFQGQEFGSSAPFHFFADHEEPLSRDVRNGRTQFMAQFRSPATTDLLQRLPVPSDDRTFRSSVLQRADTEHQRRATRLHRDLLALRRDDPAIGASNPKYFDGAVLGPQAFVIRYFAGDPRAGGSRLSDRLLLVNVAIDLRLDPAPEPLLAPPIGCDWAIHWSSEDPAYGGMGTAPLDTERNWLIPGMAAVLLAPTTT